MGDPDKKKAEVLNDFCVSIFSGKCSSHTSQVLVSRAALYLFTPKSVLSEAALTQVLCLALGLVKPHEIPVDPILELVQVLKGGVPSLRSVICTHQSSVSSADFLKLYLIPSPMSLMKMLNTIGPSLDP